MKHAGFFGKGLDRLGRWTAAIRRKARSAPAVNYRALLEGSLDMICLVEVREGRHQFIYASPSSEEVIGWRPEELLRLSPEAIYTGESLAAIAEDVAQIVLGGTSRVVLEAVRKDGQHIWVENKVRVLERHTDGISVVICTRDVTERKLLEDQLVQQALIDGLTGIENRRAFDRALDQEWKRTLRTGLPLSVALLDVDHFKSFNDSYGHLAGDDCLRAIAGAVRGAGQRAGDTVARYGGEEFAILLPATEIAAAEVLANRLCRAVAGLQIAHRGNPAGAGMVTISGGVSTAHAGMKAEMRMPEGLLLAADSALYMAKHEGRNRVASVVLNETAIVAG